MSFVIESASFIGVINLRAFPVRSMNAEWKWLCDDIITLQGLLL